MKTKENTIVENIEEFIRESNTMLAHYETRLQEYKDYLENEI